jgi:hypothetical protein
VEVITDIIKTSNVTYIIFLTFAGEESTLDGLQAASARS